MKIGFDGEMDFVYFDEHVFSLLQIFIEERFNGERYFLTTVFCSKFKTISKSGRVTSERTGNV